MYKAFMLTMRSKQNATSRSCPIRFFWKKLVSLNYEHTPMQGAEQTIFSTLPAACKVSRSKRIRKLETLLFRNLKRAGSLHFLRSIPNLN